MKYLVLVFIAIFLAGCAVELSPEAQRVAIINEKPQDCKALGAVDASIVDTSGAMSEGAMRQENENNLREQIAKLGGDTMLILGVKRSWDFSVGGYKNKTNAEVYKCAKDLGESGESIDSSDSDAKNAVDSSKSSESK